MFQIRSQFDLTRNIDFDNSLYYVHRLPHGSIPSYLCLDTRLAWRLGESVELSVTGQNLLRPQHQEFLDTTQLFVGAQAQRSVFAKVTWRF